MKRIIKKLAKMSAGEIGFRVKQKISQETDYLRQRVLGPNKPQPLTDILNMPESGPVSEMLKKNKLCAFFALANEKEKNRALYANTQQKHKEKAIGDADEIIQNKFHLLGRDFDLGEHFSWTADPVSGTEFPTGYFTKLEIFESEKVGADIKYVWELNRHQFFIELAKAYYLTGDEKYAAKIKEFITSWVDQNPFKQGVNWTSALETAVRIFAWTWSYYFTSDSEIWDDDFLALFFQSLQQHADFTEENLSHYFSPYNHLIGELASLSFLGTAFPWFKKSKNWREKYWAKLESELKKQFYNDGLIVEQATYYHHFTTGFYLQLAVLREQNDHPVSNEVREYLERAVDIAMYLTKPDGTLPMIGDIDSARSVYFYRPQNMWDLRGFQGAGAVLFQRTDMKFVAGGFSEEPLWLFGEKGYSKYQNLLARPAKQTYRHFTRSGYTIMRNDWHNDADYLCFDCGEIADGLHRDETPSVAHGHSDILSFDLSVSGKPFIIDPGFFTYNGPLEWHRYFRSGRGHNTIEIDGNCQGRHEGRMGWSGISSPQLIQQFSNQSMDFADGKIDRFAAPSDQIAQRRRILYLKSQLWFVIDTLDSPATEPGYNFASYLHFVPGKVEALSGQNTIRCLQYPDITLQISAAANTNLQTTLQDSADEDDPASGWVCRGYGYREPAAVASFSGSQQGATQLVTAIFPESGSGSGQFSFEKNGHFLLENASGRHDLLIRQDTDIALKHPISINTNAEILYVRTQEGHWQEVYLINASFLTIDQKDVYRQNSVSPYVLLTQKDGNPEVTYKINEV